MAEWPFRHRNTTIKLHDTRAQCHKIDDNVTEGPRYITHLQVPITYQLSSKRTRNLLSCQRSQIICRYVDIYLQFASSHTQCALNVASEMLRSTDVCDAAGALLSYLVRSSGLGAGDRLRHRHQCIAHFLVTSKAACHWHRSVGDASLTQRSQDQSSRHMYIDTQAHISLALCDFVRLQTAATACIVVWQGRPCRWHALPSVAAHLHTLTACLDGRFR